MATNWITTLTARADISSSVDRTPRVLVHDFGDGYSSRRPDGINNLPAVYQLEYRNISPSDHAALRDFVKLHAAASTTLLVPVWPEDASGTLKGLFYIQRFKGQPGDGGNVFNWSITLQEVFGE